MASSVTVPATEEHGLGWRQRLGLAFARRLPAGVVSAIGVLRGYAFRARRSPSQFGEDLAIEAALVTVFGIDPTKNQGFYVDVGAFHPRHFSNTWRLARAGWKGMAVDISPGKVAAFRFARRNCIALSAAIGATDGEATAYRFRRFLSATDSLSLEVARSAADVSDDFYEERVPVRSLESVFMEHGVRRIDVLSIDIEGFDLEALIGLGSFRPFIIAVEDHAKFPEVSPGLRAWMDRNGYEFYAHAGLTKIYCRLIRAATGTAEHAANGRQVR